MYLLIRSRHKNGYREPDVFTFHNVSINSEIPVYSVDTRFIYIP